MNKIIIHPHHCSREKYNELIQYLNDNFWNYKQEEDEEMETRICSKCGVEKPLTDFTKDKRKKLGIRGICKKCSSKRVCDYLKTEKGKETNKKYRKTNLYLTYRKKYENENRDKLNDYYIVANISRSCKLPRKEIRKYPELIEINRIKIKTKRLCKTLQN